jgi:ceramide glucosyltransferase
LILQALPVVLLAVCAAAFAYQLLAIAAACRHLARKDPDPGYRPGVSVLKPVRGIEPGFYDAIRSHALQEYPAFEILFGVANPADPAVAEIGRLQIEFPGLRIRLIHARREAANPKVGVLEALAAEAAFPVLLVNDSDIHVEPDYLERVVAPLADPSVGLVTCLYRAFAEGWPGRLEAVGIATDFAAGVLVAPLVGVDEFGLGSTLVFRREHLERIGGFGSIAPYLADDYQLARRIRQLGLRIHLSRTVVQTALPAGGWAGMWNHQLRWHRTIRASKGGGYLGLPLTMATAWSLAAALAGLWAPAAVLLASRLAAGALAGAVVLRCPLTVRYFWLVPLRDLAGAVLWAAALFGRSVEWRGERLRLDREGRIAGRS